MLQSRSAATAAFIILATIILGTIAIIAATDLSQESPNRDIWQHVAALRALMQDLAEPVNPFVMGEAGSRHFHPLWVGFAAFNLMFGLSVWDGLVIATYLSMMTLGAGIFLFARALFLDSWAPLLLLLTVLFGWGLPLAHTGFHTAFTFLYGAAYPATFLIGLTFVLWAATINAFRQPMQAVILIPLVAFMFATHQLGAVIAFIGVAGFVLGQPDVLFRRRAVTSVAVLAGLAISLFWPYHNPLTLILRPGNSSWEGGADFYGILYLLACLVPSIVGVLGLRSRQMRPLAIALLLYCCVFAIGLIGPQIAGRFLMPIVLVLQIGIVSFLLDVTNNPNILSLRKKMLWCGVASFYSVQIGIFVIEIGSSGANQSAAEISTYQAAKELTADIADTEHVAAFGITAWPIVGVGQKVLSVPWPEPVITDLATRQQAVLNLFDPIHTAGDRRALAQALGIRTLMVDQRLLPKATIDLLSGQAVRTARRGSIFRFDLFE